jgi:acyl carrier protein
MIRIVTRDEIEQALLRLLAKQKEFEEGALTRDTVLADAGIDSLDTLEILFAIEEEFRVSIPDERARAVKTFGDLVDLLADLLQNK